ARATTRPLRAPGAGLTGARARRSCPPGRVRGGPRPRLDLVSGHRLPLAVDGVLLMADNLVLGPGPQAHVLVPDLKKPVVLFRHRDGLGLKCPGKVTVNGQPASERGPLPVPGVVVGEEVSFAVEPVGLRLGHG